MIGGRQSPDWLSSEYLLLQFSPQRKTAIKRYISFVEAGLKNGPIWSKITNQIYLGDKNFVDKAQRFLTDRKPDIQIPKVQKRSIPKLLSEYERMATCRDEAIVLAYASGGYSYQALGDYFGLHFTRIGKIVRTARRSKREAKS